ncbi:MAG: hypothetical protein OSJ32_05740 [Muribaculaceae bacterium]|jgi:hypothetical protein|uniref:hypothetical protein n=1 Tax=Sangeribacter muris TaxID=2880703 RepID=UPI000F483582|nr:hypothetical protein [Sangeribacter muris]MBJ2193863.1 hypothetical protein [Muribaculaceae bacterium]ROT21355.1 hypothetical protein EEL52_09105 [Muribaculaceae bacterium Isolate-113 (HZI)]ROT24100.1 hypothetical protein EEL53_02010 [Muribaculaceae bacterium Isolate-114 (HZI)]RXE67911.1 hypothetical protein ED328_09510 [Muribaculaceae bacterium Isolate-001 (NCI)]MCX4280797.1 hypothetical protein [Muribaculaceae bacterium]
MKFLKLLTLSVLCISSVSCTPKFSSKVYYTDYQRYSDAGFFITESNTVSFDYVPVGSVVVRQTAGVMSDTEIISQNVPEKRGYDELYGELEKKRHSNSWKLPSDYTALDAVYKVAKEQNADGIINLKITMPEVNNADIIELSGMLIKRK